VKERGVHRWIHYRRLAIIVSPDPPRNILRISEKAVYAPCGDSIPPSQPGHDGPEELALDSSDAFRSEVFRELIPGVAHGGVAIADVRGRRCPDRRLDRAVAAADDQIVAVEIEEFDERWIERKKVTVVAGGARDPLHRGGPDRLPLDSWRDRAWDSQEGIDRRAGVEFADRFEDFLAAAHAGQPVVENGDP
jgi:hypothetical protein